MLNALNGKQPKPWYREPWPWFLMSLPATAVIAGGITIWLAVSSSDGLVVGDYYKEGLAINQTLARDEQARLLGLTARLDVANGRIQLTLLGKLQTPPAMLVLHLTHPTRAGQDHTLRMMHLGAGRYHAAMPALPNGKWHAQLEDPNGKWRLTGILHTPLSQEAGLSYIESNR
jgi:hypothetical protein